MEAEGIGIAAGGFVFIVVLILAILSLAAMIWAIVDIVRNPRLKTGEKIIWILVVLILELIGVLIYALVGRKQSPG